MYKLIAENSKGEQLNLTDNSAYVVTNIDGLHPPDATINMIDRAGHDGAMFNSAFVTVRQIILNIAINGPAGVNRNNLYRFFKTARSVRLYYYNDQHGVYIDGYVQNAPVDFFGQKQTTQITIICPDPMWHGVAEVTGSANGAEALFEFPFYINADDPIPFSEQLDGQSALIWNPGTVESGLIMTITASGSATDPRIYHQGTDSYFEVTTTLQSGDVLTINTRTDEKAVTLTRSGTTTNLIASRAIGSSWLIAEPGENIYTLSADSGSLNLTCDFRIISNIEGV